MGPKNRGHRYKQKNLRKIDQSDILDLQDEIRHQERTGGDLEKQPDSALFFLDATTTATAAAPSVAEKTAPVLGRKARARSRVTTVEKILAPNPYTQGPNKVAEAPSTRAASKRIAAAKLTKAKVTAPAAASATKDGQRAAEEDVPTDDIWDENGQRKADHSGKSTNSWLESLKTRAPSIPKSVHKPERSFAPAVQLPVGGQSYNPAYEEHQALLAKALEFETALEEEKRRHAAGTPRPMGWLKTQEALMRELTEGLEEFTKVTLDHVMAKSSEGAPYTAVNPPASDLDRKNKTQRNKEKRHKEKLRRFSQIAAEKKKEKGVGKISTYLKQIKAKEAQAQKKKAKRSLLEQARLALPRKFGRARPKPSAPALKLTEELTGSLRQLAPESTILQDRLRSMVDRNMMVPAAKNRKQRETWYKYKESRRHKEYEAELEDKLKTRKRQKAAQAKAAAAAAAESQESAPPAPSGKKAKRRK